LPHKTDSNNPIDWIYFAESDMAGIEVLIGCKISYHLCRSKLAEVLEKTLKAELIRHGWFLERTHDLQKLVDELRLRDNEIADKFQNLAETLTEAYLVDRYPGFDLEDADWEHLRQQVYETRELINNVKKLI
jgi:HEPN domain-containing protein